MATLSSQNIVAAAERLDHAHYPERPDDERRLVKWLLEHFSGGLEIQECDIQLIHETLTAYWKPRKFIPKV